MADTITFPCPNCRRDIRASAQHVGRKGKCTYCGNIVTITPPPGASSQSMVALGPDPAEVAAPTGTHVNHLLAGLIGLAATVLLYSVFYALPHDSYMYLLMTQRSFIQHTITLVTCWGLAVLALKYFAVKRELRAAERELELIPLDIGMQITSANVDKFLEHLGQLPATVRTGILARRLRGGLEHFKHRPNVSEVQSSLATQADIEASAVDSGYTVLRVFIWVCPILGFIGTVLGISFGVQKLAASLPEPTAAVAPGQPAPPPPADTSGKLIAGIRGVTDDLATAFDTTLLGLVCVVFLMFPTEGLKKIEYGMLDRVQAFANESLLRRLAEEADPRADGDMPEVVRQALDAAFREHQRWLKQWQAQVADLGRVIGAEFENQIGGLQAKITQLAETRIGGMDEGARRMERAFADLSQSVNAWQELKSGDFAHVLHTMAQLHRSVEGNTAAMGQVLRAQAELADRHGANGSSVPMLDPPVPLTSGDRPGVFGRLFGRNGG